LTKNKKASKGISFWEEHLREARRARTIIDETMSGIKQAKYGIYNQATRQHVSHWGDTYCTVSIYK
jgi:hypothetical protein